MTYKYPLQITEIPHRGERKVWTLDSEEHLDRILGGNQMCRSGYYDWCAENGYVSWVEDADGNVTAVDDHSFDLDTYLDWLRHDLSLLYVEEVAE